MSYPTVILHKHIVMEIAANAIEEGRSGMLGVLYDEVARYMHIVA